MATAFALPAFGASAGVVLTSLHSFSVFTNGAHPSAGLVQGSDGNFYGTTANGGTNGDFGTVFKISATGPLTTLYSFTLGNDGRTPRAGLVQGSDDNFYCTTFTGGTNDFGTVFKISATGALTTLYSFTLGKDGAYPYAGLVQGSDGHFYGTTSGGSGYFHFDTNHGTVFKISATGALTTLYSFTGGGDGANPFAGLVQGSDGNFYGTTVNGGTDGSFGTVFKISATGALTTLYSFTGGKDGGGPSSGLVQGSDGNLYGTTLSGGTNLAGTVFKISATGTLTTLYSFTGGKDGGSPQAGLVQGSDGNFYGTTSGNFFNHVAGTVFKISASGALTTLYSFTGGKDGGYPQAGLAQGSDGNFYGATFWGGTNGDFGTVFKISASGALTTLYSFTGGKDGAHPFAGLVQGSDGNFYGTTDGGGVGGAGTVFRLSVVAPPAPAFQAATLTNNTLRLTWTTEAGNVYQLQYSSDLASINWINQGSALTATGTALTFADLISNGPQRFYRLALLP